MGTFIACGVVAFVACVLLLASLVVIRQQTIGIVERFGKFVRLMQPGLNVRIPLIEWVVYEKTLRIRELNVEVDTKTKDNVTLQITTSVQYAVIAGKVYESYYKLANPQQQMQSYIVDIVRAEVPKLTLDAVFENKEAIATAVGNELAATMDHYGYRIVRALITDIDPNERVKAAMNKINEAERLRVAATAQGETEKILIVKKAEAEAESKRLQGEGIAKQRIAIVAGLEKSVGGFQQAIEGTTAQDVMNLVMVTQYFDTLKDVGGLSNSNVIMVPHNPAGMTDIFDQIVKATSVTKATGAKK